MLFAYLIRDARLGAVAPEALPEALGRAAWVDLLDADSEERAAVESLQPKALPDASDTQEIEESSRFYRDETGLHIHVYFLVERDGPRQITTVAFALRGGTADQPEGARCPGFSPAAYAQPIRIHGRKPG